MKPTKSMQNAASKGIELHKEGNFDPDMSPEALNVGKKIAAGHDLSPEHITNMAHFHASHNCPKDCEDLLWGGPAGEVWAKSALQKSLNTGFAEVSFDDMKDKDISFEIFSDSTLGEPISLGSDDKGLIWAPILRSGMLATRPGPNGEKLDEPLIFIPGHSDNQLKEVGLEDIVDAYNDGAIENVTIPLSHKNEMVENTGLIRGLKIVDSKKFPGQKVLLGGHEFTEPDHKGKVERGTYPSRSCGLLYNYKNTTTGKVYPVALEHLALTHKPWVGGMTRYGDLNSEDFGERTIVPMMLSEKGIEQKIEEVKSPTELAEKEVEKEFPQKPEVKSDFLADIQWGEEPSYHDVENQIQNILLKMSGGNEYEHYPQYYVIDVTTGKALVKVDYGIGPDNDAWVVPYTVDKQVVQLSPFSQWTDVSKRWVSDTVDPEGDREQLDKLGLSEAEHLIVSLYLSVSQAERDKAKSKNNSLADGSYPIEDVKHLHSAAVLAASKHGDYEAAKRLIRRRAKELGVDVNTLPGFGPDKKSTSTKMSEDPLKRASELRNSKSALGGPMTLLMSEQQMDLLGLSDEAKEYQRNQNKEIEKLTSELSETKKDEKKTRVEKRINELKGEGFDEFPGLLKEIEKTMLSDDGDIALKLQLSESGHEVSAPETATQIVERLIKTLPRDEKMKLSLGAQANFLEAQVMARPSLTNAEPTNGKDKTGDQLAEEWAGADPETKALLESQGIIPKKELAASSNGKGV